MSEMKAVMKISAFWFLTVLVQGTAYAEEAPAIGGYSPVSYFTEPAPQTGSPEFAVTHEGSTYYLRNAQEVELFSADPAKYLPRYKACPYSLALGMKKPLDPLNYRVVGGHLLLFHKSDEADGLVAFDNSGLTDEELLERADKAYVLFEF